MDAGVSQDSAERVRMFLTMVIYRKLGIHVHGIENTALFNVPAHEIPSSVICHYHHVSFRVMIYVN